MCVISFRGTAEDTSRSLLWACTESSQSHTHKCWNPCRKKIRLNVGRKKERKGEILTKSCICISRSQKVRESNFEESKKISRVRALLQSAEESGICSQGLFVFGSPGETATTHLKKRSYP